MRWLTSETNERARTFNEREGAPPDPRSFTYDLPTDAVTGGPHGP